MENVNKVFKISLIVFVVFAIIALCIVLSRGKIFTHVLLRDNQLAEEAKPASHTIGLTIDKEFISVKDKETAELKVVVDGNETKEGIEYTSSDEEVATVKDGVVTAVGVGSATITAKYEDAEATTDVKVIKPMTSIKFTSTSSSIRVGNELQLKLQVSPTDASIDTLIYYSSNDEIATVNKNGIVKGLQKGKVTITLHDTYTGTEKSVNLTIR